MIRLDDYLAEASAKRWAWGSADCVHFGLDWARARCARPLTPALAYSSREEAARLIAEHGSLLAIVGRWAAENGLSPTAEPEDGDIAVAPAPHWEGAVAAAAVVIRYGPWWLAKSAPRGLASVRGEGFPAWRLV